MSLASLSSFSPPITYSSGPVGLPTTQLMVVPRRPDQSLDTSGVAVGTNLGSEGVLATSQVVLGSYTDHLRKFSKIESEEPSLTYGKFDAPHHGCLITSSAFGKPSTKHSYTRERDFYNIALPFLKHGLDYLSNEDQDATLRDTNHRSFATYESCPLESRFLQITPAKPGFRYSKVYIPN